MISKATLHGLRRDFPVASWAIWSERFPRRDSVEASEDPMELVEFIAERTDRLRPRLVLAGLNPSTHRPGDFTNFHSTEARYQDVWLRVFVEEAGLEGAYLTDLSESVESRAAEVDVDDEAMAAFAEQLRRLGQEEYRVIAFGRDAFHALRRAGRGSITQRDDGRLHSAVELDGMQLQLHGVYHYSQVDPDNTCQLRDQLGRLGPALGQS